MRVCTAFSRLLSRRVCRLTRIDWATIGRVIERVGKELIDTDRLSDLVEISIDEVAWRKGHRYLTWSAITDAAAWCGAPRARGRPPLMRSSPRSTPPLPRASTPGTRRNRGHVVQLATQALDEVRREHWNELGTAGDRDAAKAFRNSCWSLLKNPHDLTETQADTLAAGRSASTVRGSSPRVG